MLRSTARIPRAVLQYVRRGETVELKADLNKLLECRDTYHVQLERLYQAGQAVFTQCARLPEGELQVETLRLWRRIQTQIDECRALQDALQRIVENYEQLEWELIRQEEMERTPVTRVEPMGVSECIYPQMVSVSLRESMICSRRLYHEDWLERLAYG